MERVIRIFWAHCRCKAYLLFKGMWKGECMYQEIRLGKILIATCTGSLFDGTLEIKRVFWKDE